MTRLLPLLFILILLGNPSGAQVISISDARNMPLGSTVTVSGIVTGGPEMGIIRYFQDNTAGLAAYDSGNPALAALNQGDSITITGVLFDFSNLLELQPVNSVIVHSTNNTLPQPLILSPTQLGEAFESRLVQVNNSNFSATGVFTGNTSYTVSSVGNFYTVYIRNQSPLTNQPIPNSTVKVRGILSQFGNTYQMLPRNYDDLLSGNQIQITSPVAVSNIQTNSFTLSWQTDSVGNSFVQYGLTPACELGLMSGTQQVQNHTVTLNNLNPGTIYYARAVASDGLDTALSNVRPYVTSSLSSGEIIVYFNESVNNSVATFSNAIQLPNAIDDTLVAYIDRAKFTLDCTIYDFNNTNITSISAAINAAYNRGVQVRFISDGSMFTNNLGVPQLNPMIPRIQSPVGPNVGIMHNKFVIIDANSNDPNDAVLWTGATNWTETQINDDPNNVIIFKDQSIAKVFQLEFEEMWGSSGPQPNNQNSRFGQAKIDNTPKEVIINGKRVEVYFSPSDNTNAQIINAINSADHTLHFASMVITRPDLSTAIAARSAAGVDVFGLTNSSVNSTEWNNLVAGIPPGQMLENTIPNTIMHHKYLIADQNHLNSDPLLLTGSHNWSNNANNRNDENTVIVHDAAISNIFFQEFYSRFIENGGLVLSSKEIKAELLLSVYPNPVNDGVLYTRLKTSNNDLAIIQISDLTGRVVNTIHQSLTEGENRILLDVSGLSKGVYFLSVTSGQKQTTQKFIRN
jgi:phosphatidylserine/phosphatidylglycerophosphate/cardiolipin synthase-like enzyme